MGLDNGFIIAHPREVKVPFGEVFLDEEQEVAYWRKCWNVREVILYILHGDYSDSADYSVGLEELDKIISSLKSFNKDNWNTGNSESIWTWEEIKEEFKLNITNLEKTKEFLKEHPECQLIFYDSW